jgi:hypothetical protein
VRVKLNGHELKARHVQSGNDLVITLAARVELSANDQLKLTGQL